MVKFQAILVLSFVIYTSAEKVKLTILHYNDIDSQLEAFVSGTEPPIPANSIDGVGGLARLIHAIKEQQRSEDNVMTVATANLVGGQNGWLSILGWESFGKLLPMYNPTVMGLGLREFESDLERTVDYLNASAAKNYSAPVVVSNIEKESCLNSARGSAEESFCKFVKVSLVHEFKGNNKLGIVGFVNPTVQQLSDPGNLKFDNVSIAVTENSKLFTNDVKTVIAIGSGSLAIAKQIIDNTERSPKLKLVIFGGITPSKNEIFPQIYNGVYIDTAKKYGETLGKIVLEFEDSGEGTVNKDASVPIQISKDQLPDKEAVEQVNEMRESVLLADNKYSPVGKTLVPLDGSRDACWKQECNLGNLVADSMVHCAIRKFNNSLTYPTIVGVVAVWHSGALLDDTIKKNSEIRYLDVHKWLPYHNNAYLVSVKGSILNKMFMTAGTAIQAPENNNKVWGQFLQVSNGLEVNYNKDGTLTSLRTIRYDDKPILQSIDEQLEYNLIIPSILYKGKSVYDFLPGNFIAGPTGKDYESIGFDDECLERYIRALGVLKIGFEERIFIEDSLSTTVSPPSSPVTRPPVIKECKSNTFLTVILTLVISTLIIGIGYVGWKVVWPRIQQRRNNSFP